MSVYFILNALQNRSPLKVGKADVSYERFVFKIVLRKFWGFLWDFRAPSVHTFSAYVQADLTQ